MCRLRRRSTSRLRVTSASVRARPAYVCVCVCYSGFSSGAAAHTICVRIDDEACAPFNHTAAGPQCNRKKIYNTHWLSGVLNVVARIRHNDTSGFRLFKKIGF